MRWNSFARTLGFAAVVAVGLPIASTLFGSTLAFSQLLAPYVVGVIALYAAGIAPTRTRGVTAAGLALLLGLLLLAVADGVTELAIGAALILSVVRSGLLYRSRPARAIVLEAGLLVGGLSLAKFLLIGGLGGVSLALWGYFLVQSLFFLIGGVALRPEASPRRDPFEHARTQLLSLLEEEPH